MSIEERVSRVERYIRDDADRWHAVHGRVMALRIAIGAIFDAFRNADGEIEDRFTAVLAEIEEDARRRNEGDAFLSEIRMLRQMVAARGEGPTTDANDD